MKSKRFIVEHGLEGRAQYAVNGCNTVEDLQRYLYGNPHREYRLVSVQWNNGNYTLVWERK